jgi:hypothetical protein
LDENQWPAQEVILLCIGERRRKRKILRKTDRDYIIIISISSSSSSSSSSKDTISFMQGIYTYNPETNHVPKILCISIMTV